MYVLFKAVITNKGLHLSLFHRHAKRFLSHEPKSPLKIDKEDIVSGVNPVGGQILSHKITEENLLSDMAMQTAKFQK